MPSKPVIVKFLWQDLSGDPRAEVLLSDGSSRVIRGVRYVIRSRNYSTEMVEWDV